MFGPLDVTVSSGTAEVPSSSPTRSDGRWRRGVGRGVVTVAIVASAGFALVACGGEDAAQVTSTTTSAGGSAEGGSGGSEVLAQIEERGKPEIAAQDQVTELVVTDDVEGTGAEVQAGDTITAHYVGVQASDGVEFDSSWSRGEPATFPLDRVIQGWSEGLVGMKEGGRRTLVIPAEQAYGQSPPPGSGIQPGATLVFTVDLVSVG
jgi:FKBP-type peptidyl-prolyl cis-trans isomerase